MSSIVYVPKIYVWSLTSEEQESANATKWAKATGATLVPTSSKRRVGSLGNSRTRDKVVIVAHGSNTALELGTASDIVTYTPTQLADALVDVLGMNDGVQVILAACYSDQYAVTLQVDIRAKPNHGTVTCSGQSGKFAFGEDFKV
jgi:hypothetical protein